MKFSRMICLCTAAITLTNPVDAANNVLLIIADDYGTDACSLSTQARSAWHQRQILHPSLPMESVHQCLRLPSVFAYTFLHFDGTLWVSHRHGKCGFCGLGECAEGD